MSRLNVNGGERPIILALVLICERLHMFGYALGPLFS
jgi:hypothetical protein